MKRSSRFLLSVIGAIIWLASSSATMAQSTGFKEYQVKAVFLYNFIKFITWPESVFPNFDTPVTIGVLGANPFGSFLDELIADEYIRNRKIEIHTSDNLSDLQDCNLIFISKSEHGRLDEILSGIGSQPIVTVGEIENFTRHGGIINFYLEGNKVRFEINNDSAQQRGIFISSQLLNLSKIVKTK